MARRNHDAFQTVRTEGGLLPPELLKRIAEGDRDLPGLTPADYHLEGSARLPEAITRSWNRLRGAWQSFRDAHARLAEGAADAGLTRDRWLLVLFQELGYGRLLTARGIEIDGKSVPISHRWNRSPIHLVGWRTELDKKTAGVAGAAKQSPHSLVQNALNRSPEMRWGFVSNGRQLRVLRDNATLTRQAYVEFDLEAMLTAEAYADFALLWLVCHQSRVEADRSEQCWLEKWAQAGREQGTRALDRLRDGVTKSIEALGQGFLAHPKNGALKESLRSGALDKQEYYRELLRLVYRLIFLFVAEDRDLLLDPNAKLDAKQRYLEHYSTARLRRLARRRGGPHPDGWRALRLVMEKLGDDAGCPVLALPALGSFLWSRAALPHLADAELANEDLYEAVRTLAYTERDRLLRGVDWRNLDSEELGSVYESLLELHPDVDAGVAHFSLTSAAGHERKITGSYYTPDSLVQCLLDTALDPVLNEACAKTDPERALLALKVCDPAVGSGHFLIAAARRIARRLAQVRTEDAEPDPDAMQHALRDVISHCLYGVDLNPMAIELCKVSLWLEAIEPGRALSFLDHHLQVGNSLIGATPALLAKGIPDEAWETIEGDEKAVASALKKRNKKERTGQRSFFAEFGRDKGEEFGALGKGVADLDAMPDATLADVRKKEERWRGLADSAPARRERLRADAWCAAFVWPRTKAAPEPPTEEIFGRLAKDPASVPATTRNEVERLAKQYQFLHWHLAFPDVFRAAADGKPENQKCGWNGGFDVVLGNPPWERVKLQEKEFFATRAPEIANAPNAARRRALIEKLATDDPALHRAFLDARRRAEGESQLVRESGRFPLCGRGDVNTYAVFAETMRDAISPTGRVGCIVPSGIATDDTTKVFFQDLMKSESLASLFEFANVGFFESIASAPGNRFCLLTLLGSRCRTDHAEFLFHGEHLSDLSDSNRRILLTVEQMSLVNPNTLTSPIFRTRRDASLALKIYQRVPVLIRDVPEENPWGLRFSAMIHMANDSSLFRTREECEEAGLKRLRNHYSNGNTWLPLYEAKMIHHFDHRYGDYSLAEIGEKGIRQIPQGDLACLQDPFYFPMARYWVPEREVVERIPASWASRWLIGWRNVTDARASVRTVVSTILPLSAVGHSMPLAFVAPEHRVRAGCLVANLSAFVLDFVARQKVGGINLTYGYLKQLAILPPATYEQPCGFDDASAIGRWLRSRVLELTYTAWDLAPFATDCGYDGPPFRWDEARRFLLRCELDAAFFHLYGIARDDVDYIMDTFPIVRRHDEQAHGEYRTKRVILEIYDALQRAIDTGVPYQTLLDPPPADPRVAHPAK